MSFEFHPDDPTVEAALRRIVGEQAEKARDALTDGQLPLDKSVHEARKAIKRMRALIRLVRPGLSVFKAENLALRDIARGLSALRDAGVTAGLFDRLAAEEGLSDTEREALAGALRGSSQPDVGADEAMRAAAGELAELGVRSQEWKLKGKGFAALEDGLERAWEEGRRLMRKALADPSGPMVHEWRKRVKDHWYHTRLLTVLWPEAQKPHCDAADDLGEMLGEHQDLIVLEELLAEADPRVPAERVAARARLHRAEILAQAEILAHRLYAERGDTLVARWGAWWRAAVPALPGE